MDTWKTAAEEEIRLGLAERAQGLEGRARVRTRRAAGHIVGEYFRRQGIPDPAGPNAYERLKILLALPATPPDARIAAQRLTMKVDMQFRLPPHVDLFTEVQRLTIALLHEPLASLPTPDAPDVTQTL